MIFSDKLVPKDFHWFEDLDRAVKRPGIQKSIIVWDFRLSPRGYWCSTDTLKNRALYRLHRLGVWLSWKEADLLDNLYQLFKINTHLISWKDFLKRLWDH